METEHFSIIYTGIYNEIQSGFAAIFAFKYAHQNPLLNEYIVLASTWTMFASQQPFIFNNITC